MKHFDPATSSRVKLLYIESVNKPDLLLKHASSLIRKGCRIAAIKSGSSAAGSRAASSHTGALASPDVAVESLFRKAGIVRCHSREELATVAGIFMHKHFERKKHSHNNTCRRTSGDAYRCFIRTAVSKFLTSKTLNCLQSSSLVLLSPIRLISLQPEQRSQSRDI